MMNWHLNRKKTILDCNGRPIEYSEITKWIIDNVNEEYPKDMIQTIIVEYESLIKKRSAIIGAMLNKFIKKLKTNPAQLLDNLHKNPEIRKICSHIKSKNDELYHFVKDKKDYIPYLLNEHKLNMSSPNVFSDKQDFNFQWCRDMLNLTINEDTLSILTSLMEFKEYDAKHILDMKGTFDNSSTYIEKIRDVAKINCLCKTNTNPRMWS